MATLLEQATEEKTRRDRIAAAKAEKQRRSAVAPATRPDIEGREGTELTSDDFTTTPTPQLQQRPILPRREFQSGIDEFIRALGRGSLNVGSGLLATFADVAVDSVFDVDRINELAETAREAAQSPTFQPATDGGVGGFIANAVGDALPFMAGTIAATLIGGPVAGFGVAYAVEGKSSYFDALEQGATQGQAEIEGMIVGSINATLELVQIKNVIRFAKAGKGSIKAVAAAAKQNTLRTLAKQGTKITKETVKLALKEGIQEALQETTAILAPATTGREIQKEGKLERIGQAALGGAVAGVVLGGGGRVVQSALPGQQAAAEGEFDPRFGIPVDEAGRPLAEAKIESEAEVDATLALLQAEANARAKIADAVPLEPAEREQFPELARQEDQIASLRATDIRTLPEGEPTQPAEAPVAKPPAEAEKPPTEAPAAEKPLSRAQQRNLDALAKFPQADVVEGTTRVRMKNAQGAVFQVPAGQIQAKLDDGFTLVEKAAPVEVKKPPVEAEKPATEPQKPAEEPETPAPVTRIVDIEQEIQKATETEGLMTERAAIKQISPKERTPTQANRLTAIEDELVEKNADEFPDIDISEKTRTVERRKVRDQIKEHGVYQAELDAIGDLPAIPSKVNVDSTEIGDVRARFEGRPELLKIFNLQETGGARWDEAAAEIGIDNLDEFMDAVELVIESQKPAKGGISEVALAKALNSADPAIELFAAKREMLKQGFNAAEINKELQAIADGLQIPQEFVEPELISLKEISSVAKKQQILKELDRAFKKVSRKKAVKPAEGKAVAKARVRAGQQNRPVFVQERQGKFIITVREPRSGTFVKITPPAKGEIEGTTERITAGPKARKKTVPRQTQEQKLLIQQIDIEAKKKGLTQKRFSEIKVKHGGSKRLTGRTPRTVEQLKAVLAAVKKARPKRIGNKTVITLKTEKEIAELKENLTKLGFMNDEEFQNILDIEVRGKEAKFINARNFITQPQARDVLARMHDTAQRLRVTEPIRLAIEKNPAIAAEIRKIDKLPKSAKDPSRLRSIRFFFQRMGEQANAPIYDIFLDLTLESQLRSRERHNAMKLSEALPGFAKIANDPKALQRVEFWIVSQSVLKDRPPTPTDITADELRLAKLIQASFRSYETLARAGKFFEFFDQRTKIPQYLQFKKQIDKAFDIFNTQGHDALIKYLDTQDWGIVSAGYSPMESVVRKVSTHRMPNIAVGKGRIRERGIFYRKQDRDILQRWYSYMRQMDQLVHIQPRIKSLVRLVNDNQSSFVNAGKVNSVVSTYLDNLKHTNYEDGLIEEVSRRLYSQAITVRVLADPVKVLRNLAQNVAFSEDRRDLLDPRNKKLSVADKNYLETHVQQSSVMMSDWAFTGEQPFDFFWIRRGIKKLTDKDVPIATKWVQRKTLYPASDRINRLISFHAKINRVRRAFGKQQTLSKKMRGARFSDMQNEEQRTALGIFAKDGVDAMARFVAKVHTDNTHFLYAKEQRSPAEQTKLGRIALNLALFRRAALEKAVFQLQKVFQPKTGFRAKVRAGNVLVMLLVFSSLVGILWKKLTGTKYSPYSYFNFLELNFGGLEVATIEKVEGAYNAMLAILTTDPKKSGAAIDDFGTELAGVADYMIPFYDIGLRAIEATVGSENIDRVPARKLRGLIDDEYKSRGMTKIERSLVEKIQFTFAKGGDREPDKTKKKPSAGGFRRRE